MSLYPSLEDMKVDQMQQAQHSVAQQVAAAQSAGPAPIVYPQPGAPGTAPAYAPVTQSSSLYPSLDDYMGLDLALVRQTTPQNQQVGKRFTTTLVALLSYSIIIGC